MKNLEFSTLSEKDFDEIILNSGGKRYTDDPKINELNCDYILDNTVIELKIIEEEPIEKKEKQLKFIKLFPANAKTVILYPSEKQKYSYYKILESPIKKALKKASKQLQLSAKNVNAKIRIAIIMNNGLYMVSKDEFHKIALKRAENDTSGIDVLIICSMYYYSDKFDMITLFDFKDIAINTIEEKNTKQVIDKLRKSWNDKINNYMTEQLIKNDLSRNKKPIQDLYFESNGIRYVKPPIQWGKTSKFWKNGCPKEDSTNKKEYLPLVMGLPIFDEETYNFLKQDMVDNEILQDSWHEYNQWIKEQEQMFENKIQTIIPIQLDREDINYIKKPFTAYTIQNYLDLKYETLLKKIEDNLTEYTNHFNSNNFILVEVQEIGVDKANDIAFISHIIIDDSSEDMQQKFLLQGERIKYEYAMLLASSYCISLNAERVYYIRNEDFKWK